MKRNANVNDDDVNDDDDDNDDDNGEEDAVDVTTPVAPTAPHKITLTLSRTGGGGGGAISKKKAGDAARASNLSKATQQQQQQPKKKKKLASSTATKKRQRTPAQTATDRYLDYTERVVVAKRVAESAHCKEFNRERKELVFGKRLFDLLDQMKRAFRDRVQSSTRICTRAAFEAVLWNNRDPAASPPPSGQTYMFQFDMQQHAQTQPRSATVGGGVVVGEGRIRGGGGSEGAEQAGDDRQVVLSVKGQICYPANVNLAAPFERRLDENQLTLAIGLHCDDVGVLCEQPLIPIFSEEGMRKLLRFLQTCAGRRNRNKQNAAAAAAAATAADAAAAAAAADEGVDDSENSKILEELNAAQISALRTQFIAFMSSHLCGLAAHMNAHMVPHNSYFSPDMLAQFIGICNDQ